MWWHGWVSFGVLEAMNSQREGVPHGPDTTVKVQGRPLQPWLGHACIRLHAAQGMRRRAALVEPGPVLGPCFSEEFGGSACARSACGFG